MSKPFRTQGNECKTLLEWTDVLEDHLPSEHYKFWNIFRSFNDIVSSCFSYALDPDHKRNIHQFEAAWKECSLSITPKVHLVFEHLEEVCEFYGVEMALLNGSAAIIIRVT